MASSQNTDANGIGARIRALRKERGWKQSALAAEAGMSAAQLCHVEQGRGQPSLRTLERIAKALQTTAADLLSPAVPFETPAGTPEPVLAGDALASDALARGEEEPAGAPALPSPRQGPLVEKESGMWHIHEPGDVPVDRRVRARLSKEMAEWKQAEKAAGVPGRPALSLRYPAAADHGALLAREMRTAGGLGPAAVVAPEAFFAAKGLRVLETKLPSEVSSWALWDPEDGNAFIFLRKDATAEKKRFRLAYEAGHAARFVSGGFRPVRDVRESRKISRAFATAFLLPEEAVREAAHALAIGPGDWTWELALLVKDGFGISIETFLYRIEELGMLPHARRREFRARLKAHYAACRAEDRQDFEPHPPHRVAGRLAALRFRASIRKPASVP